MQRHRHQHALPIVADRRHEDRPPREPGVELRLRQVLVLEAEPIELEGRRSAAFEVGDHRLAAAGIAAHRVDGHRIVIRHQAGVDQRPQQRDRAGRVAAGVRYLPRRPDPLRLLRLELGEAVGPAGRDAMRGRSVQHLRRRIAHAVDHRDSFARRRVRQAEDHQIHLLHQRALGGDVLALVRRDAFHRDVAQPLEPGQDAEPGRARFTVDEHGGLRETCTRGLALRPLDIGKGHGVLLQPTSSVTGARDV